MMRMMICLVGHRGYNAPSSRIRKNDGDEMIMIMLLFFNHSVDRTYVVWFNGLESVNTLLLSIFIIDGITSILTSKILLCFGIFETSISWLLRYYSSFSHNAPL